MSVQIADSQTRQRLSPIQKSILIAYAFAVVLFLVGEIFDAKFDTLHHIFTIFLLASFLGLVSIGQTLVILTGGIDLSVAYVLNAGGVFMTGLIAVQHLSTGTALVTVLVGGALIGAMNGIGIAYLNIPPLVMTLGMNSVIEGAVLIYTNGTPTGSAPSVINYIVNSYWGPIPVDVVMWIVFAVLTGIVLSRTVFGRKVYVIGNSIPASYLSGIKIGRTLVGVYAVSGLFAALAGMFLTGFANQSYLGMGDAYQLPSIAAVVIGGASILGGKGKYSGTFAGALVLTLLTTILTILNMPSAARDILYGVVILVALLANRFQERG